MTDIRITSKRYIKDKDNYTDWSEPNDLYRVDCLEIEVVDGKVFVTCWEKTPGGGMITSHCMPFDTDEAIRIEMDNFQEKEL